MAWHSPKTTWSAGDYCTKDDLNRIGENINFLLNHNTRAVVKDNYSESDLPTIGEWRDYIENVVALCYMTGLDVPSIDERPTAEAFNNIEQAILALYAPIELRFAQRIAQNYAGDTISGAGYYAGGL